jgi:hypothetical protein
MPLCPQITNTPITVVQNADFTVSSVLPVVPATTTQLDAVEVLVEGKAQIFYQTTAPVGAGINEDDLWYDTDDGNKPYIFRSGVWVSVQDGSIATAQSAANTALANAAAANAVGVAAQNTANTALTNAATAQAAAVASLQPSASTIVNSSNQMTAIAANGITVYSGSSATTGSRVVLNSAGLAGFNTGGAATFSISASTGAAVFSGSVTGSTITGGTLNIGGNAIIDASGYLTATGATITGTITSNNVTITGGTLTIGSKFSVTSLGVLTATDGVFTGTITSTNATITGGSLTVGSTFSVTSAGVLTSTSGAIGGWSISSGSISKTVGTKTLTLDSASAIITINDTSTGILSGGGINMTSGSTTGSYGAGGIAFASSGTAAILYSASDLLIQGGATTGITLRPGAGLGLQVQVDGILNSFTGSLSAGNHTGTASTQTAGAFMGSGGTLSARRDGGSPIFAHRFNASGTVELIRLIYNGSDAGGITTTSGGVPAFRNASDYRLKQNIQSFDSAASLIKQINLRSFEFVKDPEESQIGFIAHELAEVLPALVMGEKDAIDEDGNPAYQSILATNLIPYLTGALKEAILRIEALEARLITNS